MLMATCLCDAFYDEAAKATVEVLESLGCKIIFPPDQTCCGQPAFNAGDWPAARKVIEHTLEVFAGDWPIVLPSGSCTHMIRHGYTLAYEKDPRQTARIEAFQKRCWELCDFIVNYLGIHSWGGHYPGRIAFHRSCHTRGSGTPAAATQLLDSIDALERVEFDEAEQCCGFGGTFSVAYPNVSTAMGQLKLEHVKAAQPDQFAAADMACMMHMGGLLKKEGSPLQTLHIAEILRDARKAT